MAEHDQVVDTLLDRVVIGFCRGSETLLQQKLVGMGIKKARGCQEVAFQDFPVVDSDHKRDGERPWHYFLIVSHLYIIRCWQNRWLLIRAKPRRHFRGRWYPLLYGALCSLEGLQPRLKKAETFFFCSLRKKAMNSSETGLSDLQAQEKANPASLVILPMKNGLSGMPPHTSVFQTPDRSPENSPSSPVETCVATGCRPFQSAGGDESPARGTPARSILHSGSGLRMPIFPAILQNGIAADVVITFATQQLCSMGHGVHPVYFPAVEDSIRLFTNKTAG
jgi:hypothetical protein